MTHPHQGGEMYRAGLPTLGARLLAAAGFARPACTAADIGCDHGKLAVYLAMTGASRHVIAADVSPLPLERARALVQQTGCGAMVDCRLGDGLSVLAPGEAQDIILAGMSGETMMEILAAADWLRQEGIRLILVPVTHAERLRRWLCTEGFGLLAERAVCEAGRYYTVLHTAYTGDAFTPTDAYCELGALRAADGEAAREYVHNRLKHLRRKAAAPLEADEKRRLQSLVGEMEAWLE